MRRLAKMPVPRSRRVRADFSLQSRLAHLLHKDGLRHRRPADIAQAYEQNTHHSEFLSIAFHFRIPVFQLPRFTKQQECRDATPNGEEVPAAWTVEDYFA